MTPSTSPTTKWRNIAAVVVFSAFLIVMYIVSFQKENYGSPIGLVGVLGGIKERKSVFIHDELMQGCVLNVKKKNLVLNETAAEILSNKESSFSGEFDCSTILTKERNYTAVNTCQDIGQWNHSFVIFQHVDGNFDSIDFGSIYQYYDAVANNAVHLQHHYPCSTVVWMAPSLAELTDTDLYKVHMHLRKHFLQNTVHMSSIAALPHPSGYFSGEWYHFLSMKFGVNQVERISNSAATTSVGFLTEHCSKLVNTRKDDIRCMPQVEKPPQSVLVTSLGGSGTHVVSFELCKIGLDMPHERMGVDGSVSWLYAVNDWYINKSYPYGPLPTKRWLRPRFSRVIHVVRSPMKTISSVTGHSKKTYSFLFRNLPLMVPPEYIHLLEKAKKLRFECKRGGSCRLMAAAITWVFWNRHISMYADARYKIDDLGAMIEDVCLHSAPWLNKYGPDSNVTKELGNCTNHLRDRPRSADQCIATTLHDHNNPKRRHDSYSWQQLKDVDTEIAELVRQDAIAYGFTDLALALSSKESAAPGAVSSVASNSNISRATTGAAPEAARR